MGQGYGKFKLRRGRRRRGYSTSDELLRGFNVLGLAEGIILHGPGKWRALARKRKKICGSGLWEITAKNTCTENSADVGSSDQLLNRHLDRCGHAPNHVLFIFPLLFPGIKTIRPAKRRLVFPALDVTTPTSAQLLQHLGGLNSSRRAKNLQTSARIRIPATS